MPTLPSLAISDGTTTINLIDARNGFLLKDWMPNRPAMNQTRRNSLFAGGSVVRMYTYGDVVDTFVVAARNVDQDSLIANCQELDRLLTKAIDFWASNWTSSPVWIEARGAQETNTRYAIIKSYQVVGEGNPYAQPFFSAFCTAGHGELTIAVEHGIWQGQQPDTQDGAQIYQQQVYNGVTYGPSGSTWGTTSALRREVTVAARYSVANITHAFTRTAAGVFSANLIGAVKPVAFFPGAAVANGDACYWGIDSTLGGAGPFSSVVFDIGTAAVYGGAAHVEWEYYNGGAWVALTGNPCSTTSASPDYSVPFVPFGQTGVGAIAFTPPAAWATVAINGVTAWWIRALAHLAGGDTMSIPTQQYRDFYTPVWASVTVPSAHVKGDIPAKMTFEWWTQSGISNETTTRVPARLVVGLRSLSRGAAFSPYLPIADTQYFPDSIPSLLTADTTWGTQIEAASGRCAVYAPAGLKAMTAEARMQLVDVVSTNIAQQYSGQYHLYLRYKMTAGTDGSVQCKVGYTSMPITEQVTLAYPLYVKSQWTVLDLGVIRLNSRIGVTTSPTSLTLTVYLQNTIAAARTVYLHDLILMPTDEWYGDLRESSRVSLWPGATYPLYLDSTRCKQDFLAYLCNYFPATMPVADQYVPYGISPAILQANVDQKLWFLPMAEPPAASDPWLSCPQIMATVRVWKVERYQSMRGAR